MSSRGSSKKLENRWNGRAIEPWVPLRVKIEPYSRRLEKIVARPKKLKNPATSVTVVKMIDEDWAGSCLSARRMMGMMAPENPAMTIESTMEIPITIVNPHDPLHIYTAVQVVAATATPFASAT